jgi:putative ABC transport system permease protein
MYILWNAAKNLFRNKGRNILIAAVTFVVIVVAVVTLTVSNAASKIIEDARLDVGSRVEIEYDMMSAYQSGAGPEAREALSIADYEAYADSEYLKETIWTVEVPVWSGTEFAVGDESKGTGTWQGNDGQELLTPTCTLVGNSSPETLADFGSARNITQGGMFDAPNECIISEDLAELNGLSIGDTIHFESTFKPIRKYELTISGIYSDETPEFGSITNSQMLAMSYLNRRNEIITGYDTVLAGMDDASGLDITTAYYLKDPDDISKFETEVRAKGLPDSYKVAINQAAYDKVVGPLEGLKNVTFTFMIVILILGAIVLTLVSFIAVRERKYEVGVLRAMGMEKAKIAVGFITEAILITAVCLTIGLGIGSALSQPIADGVLAGQVAAAEEQNAGRGNVFLMGGGQTQIGDGSNDYMPISEIQVALGTDTLTQIIMIALALAMLSSIVGIVFITKYEPMKILRNRN